MKFSSIGTSFSSPFSFVELFRFDLEIHLVHQTPDGKTAVIGLMYEIGLPDPFLSKVYVQI